MTEIKPTHNKSLLRKIILNTSFNKDTGCIEWTGATNGHGYGRICGVDGKKFKPAHRYIYEKLYGELDKNLHIDHLCRNKKCVNPEHLEPVSLVENVMRGTSFTAQNARKSECKRGHEFNIYNTHFDPRGNRCCKLCNNIKQRIALNRPNVRMSYLKNSTIFKAAEREIERNNLKCDVVSYLTMEYFKRLKEKQDATKS